MSRKKPLDPAAVTPASCHLVPEPDETGSPFDPERPGWWMVFGQATVDEVAAVDAVIEEEFEGIDPDEWP